MPVLLQIPDPGAWMGTVMFFIFIVTVPLMLFSIPLLAIWTSHRRKMEEMRQMRQSSIGKEIQAEFAAVRKEIQSLRDTTMQYDLSFDTALQRMEARVAGLERRSSLGQDDSTPASLNVGR